MAIFALFPLGVGAFKLHQHFYPDETEATDMKRKTGIVERLSSGSNPRVAMMSDKQFEKFVRTNSVGKSCEGELRIARAKSLSKYGSLGEAVPAEAIGA